MDNESRTNLLWTQIERQGWHYIQTQQASRVCLPKSQPTLLQKTLKEQGKYSKQNMQTNLLTHRPNQEQNSKTILKRQNLLPREPRKDIKKANHPCQLLLPLMLNQLRLRSRDKLERSSRSRTGDADRSQVRFFLKNTDTTILKTVEKDNAVSFLENPSTKADTNAPSRPSRDTKHYKEPSKLGGRLLQRGLRATGFIRELTITQLQCEQQLTISRKQSTRKLRLDQLRPQKPITAKMARPIQLTPEQQIRQFEEIESSLQNDSQNQSLSYLIERENKYQLIPHFHNYLDHRQRHINWIKRAVLLNWMMELMVDFSGRRQTLNLAINIVDRYLCKIQHCPLNRLQLIGITALFIATKSEESARPALADFAEATTGVFTEEQIQEEEISVLACLGWEINCPTLNAWCLRLTVQWDLYVSKHREDLFIDENFENINFKSSDQKSYYNYRWLAQLMDFALLDIHTLRYKSRALVSSLMYLILGLKTNQFKGSDVTEKFPTSSSYLTDEKVTLNETFNNFLRFSFQILLCDLHPTIQYCSSYFILPLTFELPEKAKLSDKEMDYQDFCSYQTINKHAVHCLQRRNRDFD